MRSIQQNFTNIVSGIYDTDMSGTLTLSRHFNMEQYIPYSLTCNFFSRNIFTGIYSHHTCIPVYRTSISQLHGAPIKSPLDDDDAPFNMIVFSDERGFRGAHKCGPMMPRDAFLSKVVGFKPIGLIIPLV